MKDVFDVCDECIGTFEKWVASRAADAAAMATLACRHATPLRYGSPGKHRSPVDVTNVLAPRRPDLHKLGKSFSASSSADQNSWALDPFAGR